MAYQNEAAAAYDGMIAALAQPLTHPAHLALDRACMAKRGGIYGGVHLETAACLWEAVLDLEQIDAGDLSTPEQIRAQAIHDCRAAIGSSHLRLTVVGWTDAVDAAWKAVDDPTGNAPGQYTESFDWDFVPGWIIANVDWRNPHGPTINPPAPPAPPPPAAEAGAPAPRISSAHGIVVTCPKCGSPNVCCDAAARWDIEAQDWVLAGAHDAKTCEDCGHDSDAFIETALDALTPAQNAVVFNEAER
ncbi:hypothetical protein [Sphingomonas sp. NFR15]|uniref:hypothetical protein n=1 Tax=Sphingomonas sp. NFR15 TaxID=1566282 RepID=UPI0008922444|nr:hypothetical protein [Sphingomonas sp. NFR15]SDA14765.1 hypothetical protein SAMN03159340_00591 [Sphingomonas sp. NFR15]